MPVPLPNDATSVLASLAEGDSSAADELLPLVYDELRALAGRYFRQQPVDHTLQPTAIVHEAFLKLVYQPGARWTDRAHFFAVAAMAMRQILVSHARKRATTKRGGARRRVSIEQVTPAVARDADLVALDEALGELAQLDDRKANVVEMRFFGGLKLEEIAHVLGVSKTTVESDWRMARAWLLHRLGEESPSDPGAVPEA